MPQEAFSIRQNLLATGTAELPDFRNLGVMLRIIGAAHLLGAVTVLIREPSPSDWLAAAIAFSILLEPALLLALLLLRGVSPYLHRLGAIPAWLVIIAVTQACLLIAAQLPAAENGALWRAMLWAAGAVPAIGLWLRLLQMARSPSLAEARLMALTARIRPHFLFNSLNAILGTIRSDAQRAEKALEELAELFRALMQDPRELVPLSAEIALCRQYIELERLRLGERVRVIWDIDQCPPDALMPPLMLQPLLENAVYHGIEPASEPGVIEIKLLHSGSSIVVVMSNPNENAYARSAGNQMALANIRERLMLFYDLSASLDAEVRDGRYIVRIVLPYRKWTAS